MKLALSLLLCGALIQGARAVPVPAGRADDFVDAMGVATHWGYLDTPYGNFERAAPLLGELGVRHVRDDLRPRERELWEKYGIKTTANFSPGDIAAQMAQIKANRDLIAMIEGPNEVDIFPQSAQYKGQKFPEGPRQYQSDLYAALKADPETASIPVIAPSTARAGSNRTLRPLDAYDYLVMHSYAGGQKPSDSLQGDVNNNIVNARSLQSAGSVAKPIVVTESGYHTAVGADQTLGGVQPGISEEAGAKYFPRHFAEYWNAGITRTFTYEFLNEFPDEATNAEASFGLVRRDFTPKPAYVALKNLISLLGEAKWNAATKTWDKPAFAPRALDYDLSGDTKDVHSTLLEKADGTFILLLWREVSSWDTRAKTPIENAAARVKVDFKTPVSVSALRVSDNSPVSTSAGLPSGLPQRVPILGDIPLISAPKPPVPILGDLPIIGSLFRSKSLATVDVPDEIIALRITPTQKPTDVTAPAPPRNLTATTTGTSVALGWKPSLDGDVAGYFVSRLGRDIGSVNQAIFLTKTAYNAQFVDSKLEPATGYRYQVRAYDRAGNISAPASVVAMTKNEFPDLVVTKVGLAAGEDAVGGEAHFVATLENRGTAPTPGEVTHGVAFYVDDEFIAWSDEFKGPLAPGQSIVVKSNSGPKGSATWRVVTGQHTIRALADDVNRINEADESNNVLETTVEIKP